MKIHGLHKSGVKKHLNSIALIILPVISLIFVWWKLSKVGILNNSVLPSPGEAVDALFYQAKRGYLWKHIAASFSRVIKGYLIGASTALLLGILSGIFTPVHKIISVPVGFFRSLPAIALIPFFILWMGIDEGSKVSVIVFGTFWPVLINTIQGIHSVDKRFLEVGGILCKNRIETLLFIIIPSALTYILTGLKLGISSAWVCVVAAEMIGASKGIGFLITMSREMADPATLLVGITLIGVFGVLIDFLFSALQKRILYWN